MEIYRHRQQGRHKPKPSVLTTIGFSQHNQNQQEDQNCENLRPNSPQIRNQAHGKSHSKNGRSQISQILLFQVPVDNYDNKKVKATLKNNQTRDARASENSIEYRLGKPFMVDPQLIAAQV